MAGARQHKMAARQEAGGAEPRNLPTDCPSAVSENGRDESRTHQHTYRQLYDERPGRPRTRKRPPLPLDGFPSPGWHGFCWVGVLVEPWALLVAGVRGWAGRSLR